MILGPYTKTKSTSIPTLKTKPISINTLKPSIFRRSHKKEVNYDPCAKKIWIPLETSKGLPSGYSKSVCACVRMPSENSESTGWLSQTTRDENRQTSPPCRWPPIITTHPYQVSARSAPPLWWCGVPLVLPLRAHLLCYPKIGWVVNIICIRRFCDHINILHIFDQTFWSQARVLWWARLAVSPPPLSPSHPPTPPPSRWPALTTVAPLPSFSSFGATCVKLCSLPPSLV